MVYIYYLYSNFTVRVCIYVVHLIIYVRYLLDICTYFLKKIKLFNQIHRQYQRFLSVRPQRGTKEKEMSLKKDKPGLCKTLPFTPRKFEIGIGST